ncbi:hypothetical protein CRM22_010971 [Opisthorchis felineus]|uniref:Uncharacterized protein n=1 Tax=Opisthorchis felineus TaxID=147828 RepID=A0A4S2KGZ2_OPIFE|nr:hypothetical protein CRM22_010971 [Opisthorchis felineus]
MASCFLKIRHPLKLSVRLALHLPNWKPQVPGRDVEMCQQHRRTDRLMRHGSNSYVVHAPFPVWPIPSSSSFHFEINTFPTTPYLFSHFALCYWLILHRLSKLRYESQYRRSFDISHCMSLFCTTLSS